MKFIRDEDTIQGNIVPYMMEIKELKRRIQELEKAKPVEVHNHYHQNYYGPGPISWADEFGTR